MKNLLIAILMAFAGMTAARAEGPSIKFEEETHDFGVIKEDGGPVSYSFRFTNDGDSPLVIISATAQCGCTRPSYPKKPIEAGKDDVIKVTYIPQGRPGDFSKEVKVKTNVKGQKNVKLRISGVVLPKDENR